VLGLIRSLAAGIPGTVTPPPPLLAQEFTIHTNKPVTGISHRVFMMLEKQHLQTGPSILLCSFSSILKLRWRRRLSG